LNSRGVQLTGELTCDTELTPWGLNAQDDEVSSL